MGSIKISESLCKGCALCAEHCPENAVAMSRATNSKGYAVAELVNQDACTGCTLCAVMCPDLAIKVYR